MPELIVLRFPAVTENPLRPASVAQDDRCHEPQEPLAPELFDPPVRRLRAGEESEEMFGAADVPGGESNDVGVTVAPGGHWSGPPYSGRWRIEAIAFWTFRSASCGKTHGCAIGGTFSK